MGFGRASGLRTLVFLECTPPLVPRFCSLAVGDVTGDGHPDLYFGDYDSGSTQIFDFNNRLLINDGNAFFSDQSTQRMSDEMLLSAFGAGEQYRRHERRWG